MYLSGTNSEMLQGFENNFVNYTDQTFKYAYKAIGEQFVGGNVSVEKGKTIYLSSPQVVPSYYKFVGWTTEDDLKLGETPTTIFTPSGGYASVTTTGEMIFYPVFKAITKEVTLSVSNGKISYSVSIDGAKNLVFADNTCV